MPRLWQCYSCGSIYVETSQGERHLFTPAAPDTPLNLLQRIEDE